MGLVTMLSVTVRQHSEGYWWVAIKYKQCVKQPRVLIKMLGGGLLALGAGAGTVGHSVVFIRLF